MNKRIKRIVSVILLLALCVGNISISDSSSEAATKKGIKYYKYDYVKRAK